MEQLLAPRKGAEHFAVRPGDVPEVGTDDPATAHFAEHAGEQAEVIVLDEDESALAPGFLQHGFSEDAVGFLVIPPVVRPEFRPRERDVAQRPQALVGQTVVKALFQFGIEPNPPQLVAGVLGRHHHAVVFIHHLSVRRAGAVRHPGAAGGHHDRVQRGGHPARRADALRRAVGFTLVEKRFAVRDHDEFPPVQPIFYQLAKPFEIPSMFHCQLGGYSSLPW